MPNTAINTAQNVTITYEYAGIGKRLVASIIDVLVLFAYVIFLSYTVLKFVELVDVKGVFGIAQLSLIPIMVYTLVCHIVFNGRTVGKFVMGIKVIKEDGSPVGWSDYLTRWVFRLVDIYLFTFTVGPISILFSDKNQRLGDRAAQTIVINTRKSARISHTILEDIEQDYTPVYDAVFMFNDSDMNNIKDIYRLAAQSRDYRTLNVLRNKVESILSIKSDMPDGPFIRTIMKDYSYLTQGR